MSGKNCSTDTQRPLDYARSFLQNRGVSFSTLVPTSTAPRVHLNTDCYRQVIAAYYDATPPSVEKTAALSSFAAIAVKYVAELEERSGPDAWRSGLPPLTTDGPESWRRAACIVADLARQWEAFERTSKHATAKILITRATGQLHDALTRCFIGVGKVKGLPPPFSGEGETTRQRAETIAGWAVAELFLNSEATDVAWQKIASTLNLDVPGMLSDARNAFDYGLAFDGLSILRNLCESAIALAKHCQLPLPFQDVVIGRLNAVNLLSHLETSIRSTNWFPAAGANLPAMSLGDAAQLSIPAVAVSNRSQLDAMCDAHRRALAEAFPPLASLVSFVGIAKLTFRRLVEDQAAGRIILSSRPITHVDLNSSWSEVDPFVRFAAMALDVGQKWRAKWGRGVYSMPDLRTPLAEVGSLLAAWGHYELGEPEKALCCLDETNFLHAKPERRLWETVITAVTDKDVLGAVIHVGKFDSTELWEYRQKILEAHRAHFLHSKNHDTAVTHVSNSILFLLDKLRDLAGAAGTSEAVNGAFFAQRNLSLSVSVLSLSQGAGARRDAVGDTPPVGRPFRLRDPGGRWGL